MKKMGWLGTLAFFGIPGFMISFNFNFILPVLERKGMSLALSTMALLFIPISAVMIFVFIDFQKSRPQEWKDFLWIKKPGWKLILLCIGLFIVVQAAELGLSWTRNSLVKLPFFHVPEFFPELFKPEFEPEIPMETFLGMILKGNFSVLLYWSVWLLLNIGFEEILWRAYALKRMELYFGKWAWLVNGLAWNLLIHFFMRWSFIALLPVSLIVPFVCQKTRSFWPGVIIHGSGNLIIFALLIPSILSS